MKSIPMSIMDFNRITTSGRPFLRSGTLIKSESMNLDYIKYDDNGYPYNGMFPPTEDLLNGNDGYDSIGKGVFFYDYAVRGYNIDFNYKGRHYALMGWMDGVPIALLDADDKELQRFEDPMGAPPF